MCSYPHLYLYGEACAVTVGPSSNTTAHCTSWWRHAHDPRVGRGERKRFAAFDRGISSSLSAVRAACVSNASRKNFEKKIKKSKQYKLTTFLVFFFSVCSSEVNWNFKWRATEWDCSPPSRAVDGRTGVSPRAEVAAILARVAISFRGGRQGVPPAKGGPTRVA